MQIISSTRYGWEMIGTLSRKDYGTGQVEYGDRK